MKLASSTECYNKYSFLNILHIYSAWDEKRIFLRILLAAISYKFRNVITLHSAGD